MPQRGIKIALKAGEIGPAPLAIYEFHQKRTKYGRLEKFGTQGVPVHETHALAWTGTPSLHRNRQFFVVPI